MGKPSRLECSRCGKSFTANQVHNLCECGGPLLVKYDLANVAATWSSRTSSDALPSMWRYAPVLPAEPGEAVSLREGWTPLIHARSLGSDLAAENLWV